LSLSEGNEQNQSHAAELFQDRLAQPHSQQSIQHPEYSGARDGYGRRLADRSADENYAAMFDLETLIGRLAGIFAALAIFISCLGLFGLAAYVAEQRTKEIGIRKVLGASIAQVFLLITKDFIVLVLISCLLASPFAFYFLHGWLQGYYYRISIGPWVFVISSAAAILITITTISFQAIRAALMNPVKSLRTE
jgi:putative ABC transport system permease protein